MRRESETVGTERRVLLAHEARLAGSRRSRHFVDWVQVPGRPQSSLSVVPLHTIRLGLATKVIQSAVHPLWKVEGLPFVLDGESAGIRTQDPRLKRADETDQNQ